MFDLPLIAKAITMVILAALPTDTPQSLAADGPQALAPAPVEQELGVDAAHDHDYDACCAEETNPDPGLWVWRNVIHFNCGWTATYFVFVPGYTNLVCTGCGYWFTAYVPY